MLSIALYLSWLSPVMIAGQCEDDLNRFIGEWNILHDQSAGEPSTPKDVLREIKVIISREKISFRDLSGKKIAALPFRIDPSKSPKTITISVTILVLEKEVEIKKTISYPGIYALEGTKLKICFSLSRGGNETPLMPPTAFQSTAEQRTRLIVLERPTAKKTTEAPCFERLIRSQRGGRPFFKGKGQRKRGIYLSFPHATQAVTRSCQAPQVFPDARPSPPSSAFTSTNR